MRQHRFNIIRRNSMLFWKTHKKPRTFVFKRFRVVFNHFQNKGGSVFFNGIAVPGKKVFKPRKFLIFKHFPEFFLIGRRNGFFYLRVNGNFIGNKDKYRRIRFYGGNPVRNHLNFVFLLYKICIFYYNARSRRKQTFVLQNRHIFGSRRF